MKVLFITISATLNVSYFDILLCKFFLKIKLYKVRLTASTLLNGRDELYIVWSTLHYSLILDYIHAFFYRERGHC